MNWTIIISTAITAAINGLTMYLVMKLISKAEKHIEKVNGKKK